MKETLSKIKFFLNDFFKKIGEDNIFNSAASLAYYAVFSLTPFLYIVINILGILFNEQVVSDTVCSGLSELIGQDGSAQLQAVLVNLGIMQGGWVKSVVGAVVLVFTATTIFATIQTSLNYIFRVKMKRDVGILKFFKTRLIGFAFIIGIILITLFSLLVNGVLLLFTAWLSEVIPFTHAIFDKLNDFVLPYLASVVIFTVIFKFLPDAKAAWKDLIIGASFTALLFALGRYLIAFYINNSGIDSIYEAAGSLMVIFVWMYYSSFIFYLGAIFTVLYAESFGSGISAEKNTVRFIQRELEVDK